MCRVMWGTPPVPPVQGYGSLELCVVGVTDYLCAEVSTSKQKKFSLVTFVDTPGLVDGDMIYPFDVNSAITSFGKNAEGGGV